MSATTPDPDGTEQDPQHDSQHDPGHDQDAEPPTPTGEEPDADQLRPGSEPASDPDPDLEQD